MASDLNLRAEVRRYHIESQHYRAVLGLIAEGSAQEMVCFLSDEYGENDKYWRLSKYPRWRNRVIQLARAALEQPID